LSAEGKRAFVAFLKTLTMKIFAACRADGFGGKITYKDPGTDITNHAYCALLAASRRCAEFFQEGWTI
jgi:hypothetical protein